MRGSKHRSVIGSYQTIFYREKRLCHRFVYHKLAFQLKSGMKDRAPSATQTSNSGPFQGELIIQIRRVSNWYHSPGAQFIADSEQGVGQRNLGWKFASRPSISPLPVNCPQSGKSRYGEINRPQIAPSPRTTHYLVSIACWSRASLLTYTRHKRRTAQRRFRKNRPCGRIQLPGRCPLQTHPRSPSLRSRAAANPLCRSRV